MADMLRFALLGNPNCGKTTLFNMLTGSRAHVGNWPGVTVEKKEGVYRGKPENVTVTDLPGIYSLSPYSPEEIVTRNYILKEKPDAIIDIVDATNLERNLYLTTQALEIDIPVIVALNMIDVVEREGDEIDLARLERALGVPVVSISALKGNGIEALMTRAVETARTKRKGVSVMGNSQFSGIFSAALDLYREKHADNPIFRSVKMLENDEVEVKAYPDIHEKLEYLKRQLPENVFENDFEAIVADARYQYITANYSPALRKKRADGMTQSGRIDRVLTHRIWGIPIFLGIMFLVFHLTFSENLLFLGVFIPEGTFSNPIFGTDAINSPGVILTNCVNWCTDSLMSLISGALPKGTWYSGLICDGLLSGVFAVLSFIPQILCLFLFLSILEDSGYMARVAFIMDKAFRKFGLSGRAFLPLLMCFGCAVPGIMATRTLENDKERRLTAMLTPFFSCGAKLPIWATFAAVLFGGAHGDLVVFSMYLLGILVAVIAALILNRTVLKGEMPTFIMELPAYHLPQFKNTMIHLWEKLKHYLERAATIIAGAVVVIWFFSHFSFTFRMVEDMGDSMIGVISKAITWLFVPLGFGMGENGWQFVVAVFTGFIAKEMVVATLGTFAGMSEDALGSGELAGTAIAGLIGSISVPAAFAFMAFNLLSMPCMAAVAAARGELKSGKKLWAAIGFWMGTAYVVSAAIYWVGTYWWIGLILAGVLALAWGLSKVLHRRKRINGLD